VTPTDHDVGGALAAADPRALRRALAWDALAFALIVGVAVLALVTHGDYGVTYDEQSHIAYGNRIHGWYLAGMPPSHAIDSPYGGGYDLLGAVVRQLVYPRDQFTAMHLLGGLIGVLGLVGAWKLGRLLFGAAGGCAAVLLLALIPDYYGSMFDNPKDIPFAVGYVWALYYLAAAGLRFPAVPWHLWARLGVACGVAISVRVAGLLVPCYLALAIAAYVAAQAVQTRSSEQVWQALRRLLVGLAITLAAAWLVMLPLWPWVIADPLHRPLQALRTMSAFEHVRQVAFGDQTVWTTHVPWDYLPRYFLLKLPELVLALLAVATVLGARRLARGWRDPARVQRSLALAMVAVAVVLPPLYAMVKGSTLYDGLRHFLFLLPPLAVIAAGGLIALLAVSRDRRVRAAIAAAVLLAGARQAWVMADLHPHEYVYYNALAGGLAGATSRYDTDYYGESYREAFHDLADHLWRTEPATYLADEYRVQGCLPLGSESALPGNFVREHDLNAPADFWAGYTRGACHLRHADRPVVAEVNRQGALLSLVRDLRPPPPPPGSPWLARYYGELPPGELAREPAATPGLAEADPPALPQPVTGGRWLTCVIVDRPTRITWALDSDGTARLWLDRQALVEGGDTADPLRDHDPGPVDTVLGPGAHDLAVDQHGGERLVLTAAIDGGPAAALPAALLHSPGDQVDRRDPCWRYRDATGVLP